MFSFNFNVDSSENCDKKDASIDTNEEKDTNDTTEEVIYGEVTFSTADCNNLIESCGIEETMITPDYKIYHIDLNVCEEKLKQSSDSKIKEALDKNSDVIPQVYEGGLKVWECSIDLCAYLKETNYELSNLNILELGCGIGLPGIYTLSRQPASVTFSDYNKEVLEFVTCPSVFFNSEDEDRPEVSFIYGDWSVIDRQLRHRFYDLILMSETIYDTTNYKILLKLLDLVLSDKGEVLLASKNHYFGVGGGTRLFEKAVENHGIFKHFLLKSYPEGLQREILKLARR
ncbi:DgyrCDS2435 [Dimorphilus gyrociliatus]|uniref:protein-histidine N-methyltransferase n=1 Tax=Dimorphilus gyrociliatus TaxID=2664684 RepID=A0A7I8VBL9_9ANNE|nr:DgyrCDS2435 [Dimorphilus gyrociliatus]